jgi:hypothetical protein
MMYDVKYSNQISPAKSKLSAGSTALQEIASQGASLGGLPNMTPAMQAFSMLDLQLEQLRAQVFRLNDRLAVVLYSAPPQPETGQSTDPAAPAGAPLLEAISQATERVAQMGKMVSEMADRLVI